MRQEGKGGRRGRGGEGGEAKRSEGERGKGVGKEEEGLRCGGKLFWNQKMRVSSFRTGMVGGGLFWNRDIQD